MPTPLPQGRLRAQVAAGACALDAAVHAWDIAVALGRPDFLPCSLAEQLLPALRTQAPQVIPRLANCFYWAVISHGQPEDLRRYQRVFGTPPDDPQLARMEALALEHRHMMPDAHKAWERFEKSVAARPSAWPDGVRMNAASRRS